jgi:S1-C subfamily serine protease
MSVLWAVVVVGLAATDLETVAASARPSVAMLLIGNPEDPTSSGTGFLVTRRWVATNHHVIAHAGRVTAEFADGSRHEAVGLVADDAEHDLALVALADDAGPPLALGDSGPVVNGQQIFILGGPLGLAFTVFDGTISAIRAEGELERLHLDGEWTPKGRLLQLSSNVTYGSSGSPVLDREANVIGVAQSIIPGSRGQGFCVPIEAVKALLTPLAADAKVSSFPRASERTRNLVISMLALVTGLAVWWRSQRRTGGRSP